MPYQDINDTLERIEILAETAETNWINTVDDDNHLITIDVAHAAIHSSTSYTVQVGDESVLGDNATLNVAFRTGLSEIHLFVDFDTLVAGWLTINEGPTWTAGTGTAVSIMSRDRSNVVLSTVRGDAATGAFADGYVVQDATGGSGGTVIDTRYAYGTKQIGAPVDRGLNEFILPVNTNYIITFTATGGSNRGFIRLNWYEK